MDAFFIVALVFFGIALVLFVLGKLGDSSEIKGIGIFNSILGGIFLIFSTFVIVGTNQVGIFTEAGAAYTATDNGFEWKRPWAIKTEFDASRQFLRFCDKGNDDSDADKKVFPQINVKIAGNAKADICGTISWQEKASTDAEKTNAIQLFKDYKQFERVTTNLVYPSVAKTLNNVMANHNPLIADKNMSISEINEKLLIALRAEFGEALAVMSVDVRIPDKGYDDITDNAIAQSLAQIAQTNIAIEKEKTNAAESRANAAIVASIQNDQVLINKCLEIAEKNGTNPGLCFMGVSSGIIINPDTTKK